MVNKKAQTVIDKGRFYFYNRKKHAWRYVMKLIPLENTSQADPYIIEHKGEFYIYASGHEGVQLYKSASLLKDWEYVGIVAAIAGKMQYWAPSVIKLDGKFYMYVSCMNEGEEDTHLQTMHVFESDKPEGPFINGKKLIEPFSIDSHVVKTEAGLFMFYSVNDYEAERAGTYIVVDKMLDPYTMEGKPVSVIRPTLDEEIFQRDRFKKGQHWHTLEGAFYFREGNRHFITYSGNCYQSEFYYVGYAYAETEESDLTKIKFTKYPDENTYEPLLKKNDEEEGTGHNSILDYKGEKYIIYHGRDWGMKEEGDEDLRTARAKKLKIDGVKITAEKI
jgi:GH43 family beta-xylosidase